VAFVLLELAFMLTAVVRHRSRTPGPAVAA